MKSVKISSDQQFLQSLTKRQWERIGVRRRSGVLTPLFSIHSDASIGIGEIPDLKLLMEWCYETEMSIVQLLPLNDVGFHFRPYDADSSFALDPMYLSLEEIFEVDPERFRPEMELLKKRYPINTERVHYEVKGEKLRLLWEFFISRDWKRNQAFQEFRENQSYWLDDYVMFRTAKQEFRQKAWWDWPAELKERNKKTIQQFQEKHKLSLLFHAWQQWQLFYQMREAHQFAKSKEILMMGDLPLLVSLDSADVWANPNYFKTNLSSGAPPDQYFAKGQRWGMPVYNWDHIKQDQFQYLTQKLKYAEQFYDLFRVDHAIGLFRLWTIQSSQPSDDHGLHGCFEPKSEEEWIEQGKMLLNQIVQHTTMLPCAEDLGTIPECMYEILAEFGIPGMNIQRWERDASRAYEFKAPKTYRVNSIASLSNHDMPSFAGWWEFEVNTVDASRFEVACEQAGVTFEKVKKNLFDLSASRHGRLRWKKSIRSETLLLQGLGTNKEKAGLLIDFYRQSYNEREQYWCFVEGSGQVPKRCNRPLLQHALQKINASSSIFSIQLIQDWLGLDPDFQVDPWCFRINFPGVVKDENWSVRLPISLEKLLTLEKTNKKIKELNKMAVRSTHQP
jgi:4-alpha-glucanotransferase